MWTVYKRQIFTVAADYFHQTMCEECESERATTLVFRLHRQTDTYIHTLTWNNTGFIITHGEHPFLSPFMEMRARPPVSVLCVWFTRTPTCFGKFSAYTSTCSTRFPLDNTFAWRLRTHPHRRKHRLTHEHPHFHMTFSVYIPKIEASSALTSLHGFHIFSA